MLEVSAQTQAASGEVPATPASQSSEAEQHRVLTWAQRLGACSLLRSRSAGAMGQLRVFASIEAQPAAASRGFGQWCGDAGGDHAGAWITSIGGSIGVAVLRRGHPTAYRDPDSTMAARPGIGASRRTR